MQETTSSNNSGIVFLLLIALFVVLGAVVFFSLPDIDDLEISGHAKKHPEAQYVVNKDTDFACKFLSSQERTKGLFLEWDPRGNCPPIFNGVVVDLVKKVVITAFAENKGYWLRQLESGRYQ